MRKELFAFTGNKIAVQFWYEFFDENERSWYRCYGLGKCFNFCVLIGTGLNNSLQRIGPLEKTA